RAGRHAARAGPEILRDLGSDAVRGMGAGPQRRSRGTAGEPAATRSVAVHVSVLADEVVFLLRPRGAGWVIDGTVGMGGHAEALLRTSEADVRLLGLDVDPDALARAAERLRPFGARVTLERANFRDVRPVAARHRVEPVQSVLLDLGVSS